MTIGIKANIINDAFKNAIVDGYARVGYEIHNVKYDDTFNDGAVGGKLHIETAPISSTSIGASFYTSNSFGSADNKGLVPFRGEVANSYAILGEAYIKIELDNTLLKIGRQELDTPFAQVDDIGIVPNTFEAYILENKDIPHTTLFIGQIQKMAGVDAKVVDRFTKVNDDDNMQAIGLSYDGIENMTLNTWYYRLKDAQIDNISYLEASYEGSMSSMGYNLGLQYAKQTYTNENDTVVYGISASTTHDNAGLTLGIAYNKVDGNAATSGFGGGPFFSNSEYLIIDNAGADGSQTWFGVEYDASTLGLDGLTVAISKAILKTQTNTTSTEIDLVASYEVNKNMELHMIYSDLDGANVEEDIAKHLRVFANYNF